MYIELKITIFQLRGKNEEKIVRQIINIFSHDLADMLKNQDDDNENVFIEYMKNTDFYHCNVVVANLEGINVFFMFDIFLIRNKDIVDWGEYGNVCKKYKQHLIAEEVIFKFNLISVKNQSWVL